MSASPPPPLTESGVAPVNATFQSPALRITQGAGVHVYLFAGSASDVLHIATLSRIRRDGNDKLRGYQRPEVRRHVADIVEYLGGTKPLFPNPILLGFSRIEFHGVSDGASATTSESPLSFGEITIPTLVDGEPDTGWIVDGQQRTLALSKANDRLCVPIAAFEAPTVDSQRDQFIRINNVRPLPPGLIAELLPTLTTEAPQRYRSKRIPSILCERLNQDPESPFHALIRRASTPKADRASRVVSDTALVNAIESSISSPNGCLFSYQNLSTGQADVDGMYRMLKSYWGGVRDTFPSAWGRPSRQSRLMHSVGINAMGALMNTVMRSAAHPPDASGNHLRDRLSILHEVCAWTEGTWPILGGLPWNALQNTALHLRLLNDLLQHTYRGAVR